MSDADGADWPPLRPLEPQGEQAQMDLRHWDGDPSGGPDERAYDAERRPRQAAQGNWSRLLKVYDEIEEDPIWDYLRQPGIRLVPGDGEHSADAKLMIVGEAPGARENGEGRPFVGQSGMILDQLIELAGLKRERCFLTNVVKYRPPGNATPGVGAVLHGQLALRKEFSIVRPTLVVAVGATAHSAVHPRRGLMSIGQCRVSPGRPFEYPRKDDSAPLRYCISIYHPAFGLRAGKRIMEMIERDWEALGEWIKEEQPDVLE